MDAGITTQASDNNSDALLLTDKERIEKIRNSRWIGYTNAKKILDKLDDLLTHPKTHRMPNMLIVGETNNGKTMIVNRFRSQHLAYDNANGDGITLPVLLIQAPPTPDEGRFYNVILDKLFASYKVNDRVDKKCQQIINLLSRLNVKMLVIDEIHNVVAGNLNKQRCFLNTIKYLGSELQIPIVGVGIKEAFNAIPNAIQTDLQLANRFEPVLLPRWELNAEFLKLLASFEKMLSLKEPSNLAKTDLAIELFNMSEGIIGELNTVLIKAALKAVDSGEEHINFKILKSIDWLQPSKRKCSFNKDRQQNNITKFAELMFYPN